MRKLIFLLLFIVSCDTIIVFDDATHFTIEKDNHYSQRQPIRAYRPRAGDIFEIRFIMDTTCWYTLAQSPNARSWNKLVGFKDSIGSPHKNSYRIGWRPAFDLWTTRSEKKIELCHYYYINGKRHIEPFTNIDINRLYQLTVRVKHRTLYIDDDEITFEMRGGTWWQTNFYFGGELGAPWTINANINIEKR